MAAPTEVKTRRTGKPGQNWTRLSVVVVPDLTPTQWAYLAGFMDGEGSFCIVNTRGGRKEPRITVGQNHKEPLGWMKDVFGGSLYKRTPKKEGEYGAWFWSTGSIATAYVIASGVRPYVIVKRDAVDSMLAFLEPLVEVN